MFRTIRTLLIIIVFVALIAGGVLEVRVHPENLGSVPNTVLSFVGSGDVVPASKLRITKIRRQIELYVTEGEEKKLALLLKYVQADADLLITQLESDVSVSELAQGSAQLTASIDDAAQYAKGASEEVLAASKENTVQAIGRAKAAQALFVQKLEGSEEFTELADATLLLKEKLAGFPTFESTRGEVAGTQDETPEPSPDPTVPLRF